ncbi:MAG: P1 family peptidase [Gemmatimonadota bacterium]
MRDLGIIIGRLPSGPLNAITDVGEVRVGHRTVIVGDSIRTGVTAILPHPGNLFRDKVRAAVYVGNGFGKLVGLSQVSELGELETPILLTGTLSVFRAADALVDTLLRLPENAEVISINPLVGETNDGYLSDIRARPIAPEHVREALRAASPGVVEEGSVGAGTGTRALGWKGGIGTSSRVISGRLGGFTVGVLVQSNFGGELTIAGVPVGRRLRAHPRGGVPVGRGVRPPPRRRSGSRDDRDGSVMIVVATDAPLAHRELERLAARTMHGVARTGSAMSHGSGDYAIAFSTHRGDPIIPPGSVLSALFIAAMEATEEAVLNSLFRATTVTGWRGHRAEALPVDRVMEILEAAAPVDRG